MWTSRSARSLPGQSENEKQEWLTMSATLEQCLSHNESQSSSTSSCNDDLIVQIELWEILGGSDPRFLDAELWGAHAFGGLPRWISCSLSVRAVVPLSDEARIERASYPNARLTKWTTAVSPHYGLREGHWERAP